jgi:hypothetical protein
MRCAACAGGAESMWCALCAVQVHAMCRVCGMRVGLRACGVLCVLMRCAVCGVQVHEVCWVCCAGEAEYMRVQRAYEAAEIVNVSLKEHIKQLLKQCKESAETIRTQVGYKNTISSFKEKRQGGRQISDR